MTYSLLLRNPQVLMIPEVQQLLKRAVDQGLFLAPGGFDTVAQDIFNFVTDPRQFMVLGAQEGKWKACCMGFLPSGNLFPYPTIVMIYNEGNHALAQEVEAEVMDFIVSNGYTRVLAVNTSGHSDKAWQKVLTLDDVKSEKIGSLVMFEVK